MSMGQTPQKRRPQGAALAIAAVLMAIAAVLIWDASRINSVGGYSPVGPATVPITIGVVLILLGIGTVISSMRDNFPQPERQDLGLVGWVVAGLVGQMLLLNVAGFSIATGVLFALTARAFGKTNLAFNLAIGVSIALVIYLIFAGLLKLSLPAGPLEKLFL
jgi:putative tricarboxylic transport membrane protein